MTAEYASAAWSPSSPSSTTCSATAPTTSPGWPAGIDDHGMLDPLG